MKIRKIVFWSIPCFMLVFGSLLSLIQMPQHAQANAAWQIIDSPSPGTTTNSLSAIASVSPTQLYGVGTTDGHTLLLSSDGKTWKQDNSFSYEGTLTGISTDSSGDIFISGNDASNNGFMVYKLNGGSWIKIAIPNGMSIMSIKAFSATQVWVVGSDGNNGFAWFWDGTSFTSYQLPDGAQNLRAMQGDSSTDLWVAGIAAFGKNYIAKWDGTSWKSYTVANPGVNSNTLTSLSVFNGDVWAVGFADIASKTTGYVLHLENGQFVLKYTATANSSFSSIIQTSATELWSVGIVTDTSTHPFALHSSDSGNTWTSVTVPNRDTSDGLSQIISVSGVLWSVGMSSHAGNNPKTLIEEYSSTPDPSPTATASQSPTVTSTATASPTETSTAVASPTETATGTSNKKKVLGAKTDTNSDKKKGNKPLTVAQQKEVSLYIVDRVLCAYKIIVRVNGSPCAFGSGSQDVQLLCSINALLNGGRNTKDFDFCPQAPKPVVA